MQRYRHKATGVEAVASLSVVATVGRPVKRTYTLSCLSDPRSFGDLRDFPFPTVYAHRDLIRCCPVQDWFTGACIEHGGPSYVTRAEVPPLELAEAQLDADWEPVA